MTRKRRRGDMREHRTVVLPDYQGLGIGNRLSEFCASIWKRVGGRAFSTTGHPAMIRYRSASPNWRRIRLGMAARCGPTGLYGKSLKKANRLSKLSDATSCKRLTAGFQYIGPGMEREQAEQLAKAQVAPLTWYRRRIRERA